MNSNNSKRNSPINAVSKEGFLTNNIGFVVISILSILAVLVSFPFLFDKRQGWWNILSLITLLFCIYGVGRTFYEITKIEIENYLISKIKHKAGDYNVSEKRVELDDLKNEISPPDTTYPTPAMIRLIDHIVDEAKIGKYDSSVSIMQPYKDEAFDIIFKLQNYQKIVLWIGIAGTFVGILEAIKADSLAGFMDKSAKDFGDTLTTIFGSLSISFSASLAGLISATILGCFILLVKKKQETYFKTMESVVTMIVTSARKSKNKDKYRNEIEEIKDEVLKNQNITAELQKTIYEMQKQIIIQNGQIQESINRFLESNKEVNKVIDETKKEVNYLHNSIGLKSVLDESIKAASKSLSSEVSSQVSILSKEIENFNKSAIIISQGVEEQSKQTRNLNSIIGTRMTELTNSIRNLRFVQGGFWGFINRFLNK